jgi:glycosyltransferase involved in cell wall biosynthesis
MRFLLLPMKFPVEPDRSYLTTELAEALLDAGHQVEVLHLDWDATPGGRVERLTSPRGIPVVRVGPRVIGRRGSLFYKASKFVLSSCHVGREARRYLAMGNFDVIVAWMPGSAFAPVIRDACRAGVPARLLFVGDFFPDHHAEIGVVPRGPLRWLAKAREQSVLRRFTMVFCTLPANCDYLRQHFRLAPGQQVRAAPNWTALEAIKPVDRANVRARYGLPAEAPIAVFGGQLAAGRGFDQMLEAADIAHRQGSPLVFLFVGDGPLAEELARDASARPNVLCLPAMPTAHYRELLAACDVGMAATVPGVSSHTTPSKTLDYLKAGMPIVIAVEAGNEFAELFEQRNVGRAVAFGDAHAFQHQAAFLATDTDFRRGLTDRTYKCLAEIFDVKLAVSAILEAAGERQEKSTSARNPTLNAAWVVK